MYNLGDVRQINARLTKSIRFRFFCLTLLAIVPLIGELTWRVSARYEADRLYMLEEVESYTRKAQTSLRAIRLRTHALLELLPDLNGIDSARPAACSDKLRAILARYDELEGLSITDKEGLVICSTQPEAVGVAIGDRPYFKKAWTTGAIATSDFLPSDITGDPTLVIVKPVAREGQADFAIMATINRNWFLHTLVDFTHHEGAEIFVFNPEGNVLAAYPPDNGSELPDAVRNAALEVQTADFRVSTDPSSTVLIGLFRVEDTSTNVALVIPMIDALANANRATLFGILGAILAGGAIFILFWAATERFFLGPLGILVGAAKKIIDGDLSARANLKTSSAEMTVLELAFNSMVSHLETLAHTDSLTGLPNRRELQMFLRDALAGRPRHSAGVCFALIDIDRFKQYNDTFGHQAGDECLRRIAKQLRALAEPGRILAARFGGEEFALVFKDCTGNAANKRLQKLQAGFAAMAIPHGAPGHPFVTASIGLAQASSAADDSGSLIARADAALYEAKRAGRNRIVVADEGQSPDDNLKAARNAAAKTGRRSHRDRIAG